MTKYIIPRYVINFSCTHARQNLWILSLYQLCIVWILTYNRTKTWNVHSTHAKSNWLLELMFINFPSSLTPSTIGILLRPRSVLNFPHQVMSHSNCLTEPWHPSGKGPRPLLGTELKNWRTRPKNRLITGNVVWYKAVWYCVCHTIQ